MTDEQISDLADRIADETAACSQWAEAYDTALAAIKATLELVAPVAAQPAKTQAGRDFDVHQSVRAIVAMGDAELAGRLVHAWNVQKSLLEQDDDTDQAFDQEAEAITAAAGLGNGRINPDATDITNLFIYDDEPAQEPGDASFEQYWATCGFVPDGANPDHIYAAMKSAWDAQWVPAILARKEVTREQLQEMYPAQESAQDISYEVVQDDMVVAGTSGSYAFLEIMRYANQYQQDGPVQIVKVVRTVLYPVPSEASK